MKLFALLVSVLMLMVNSSLHAHQDTRLKFEKGKITGLPEKYLPASFDIKNQSLSLAGKTLIFPDVLKRIFTFDANLDPFNSKPPKIEAHPFIYSFAASWYPGPDGGDFTSYMLIKVTPPDGKVCFELRIDMDKLIFQGANIWIEGIAPVPIDLDGILDKIETGEQVGTGQPATRPELKSEGSDKPQPKAEGRSR